MAITISLQRVKSKYCARHYLSYISHTSRTLHSQRIRYHGSAKYYSFVCRLFRPSSSLSASVDAPSTKNKTTDNFFTLCCILVTLLIKRVHPLESVVFVQQEHSSCRDEIFSLLGILSHRSEGRNGTRNGVSKFSAKSSLLYA